MKIHIKQEIILRQHIQNTYKWQENSEREQVELIGMSRSRIWMGGEEGIALGFRRAGLGKSRWQEMCEEKPVTNLIFLCLQERKQWWSSQSSWASKEAVLGWLCHQEGWDSASCGGGGPRGGRETGVQPFGTIHDSSLIKEESVNSGDSFLWVLFLWKGTKVHMEGIKGSGRR